MTRSTQRRTLLITCGAMAHEMIHIVEKNGWNQLTVHCLPAQLHFTPQHIPGAVRTMIRENRQRYDRILVLYSDCGTGGLLDKVLEEEQVERIPGAHCYEMFAGRAVFARKMAEDAGTFFLTDFMVRHYDKIIARSLGIDRLPQLKDMYFKNYNRLVYLAQTEDKKLQNKAEAIAQDLDLAYDYHFTGYGDYTDFLAAAARKPQSSSA